MKIFSRQPRPPRPLPESRLFVVYYVRSGEYDYNLPMLTPDGRDQARMAAEVIRAEAESKKVVVFADYAYGQDSGPYRETAKIIAQSLGTSTVVAPFRYTPVGGDIRKLTRFYHDDNVNHFVRVVNGTLLGKMLGDYPGPDVPIGFMGPANGSVHALRYELDIYGEIATRRFV